MLMTVWIQLSSHRCVWTGEGDRVALLATRELYGEIKDFFPCIFKNFQNNSGGR